MDKFNMKAQSAMEFIFLVGMSIFFLTIILWVVSINSADINKKRVEIEGNDLAIKIQREILLASDVLDGYTRTFTLPQRVSNKNYEMIVRMDEIIIRTPNGDFFRPIPDIEGNFTKGLNTIKKENGTVYVN